MPMLLLRRSALFLLAAALLTGCGKEPTLEKENAAEKSREIATAFTGAVTDDGGKHAAGIKKFFDDLGAALRANDQEAVRKHMDLRMMVQLLDKQNLIPKSMKGNRKQLVDAINQMLPAQLCDPGTGIVWQRNEIRKVRFVAAEDEAVVIVRNWDADGMSTKTRWWIYKDGDNWRGYDLEILEMSMRFSTLLGVGFSEAEKGGAGRSDLQSLLGAVAQLTSGDVDGAEKALTSINDANLPPVLVAMRHVFIAGLRIDQRRFDEALKAINTAEAAHPDMPMAHAFRAAAYNGLKKYDEALAATKAYLDTLGEDATILLEIGDAKLGQGKTEEAIKAYRAGLKDDPQNADNLVGLVRAEPDKAASLAADYKKLDGATEMFPLLVDGLVARGDKKALAALIELHRGAHPQDAGIKAAEEELAKLK